MARHGLVVSTQRTLPASHEDVFDHPLVAQLARQLQRRELGRARRCRSRQTLRICPVAQQQVVGVRPAVGDGDVQRQVARDRAVALLRVQIDESGEARVREQQLEDTRGVECGKVADGRAAIRPHGLGSEEACARRGLGRARVP